MASHSLQTVWQYVKSFAAPKVALDSDQEGNVMTFWGISFMIMYSALLFRLSKNGQRAVIGLQIALGLSIDYLIHLGLVDIAVEKSVFRVLWILQIVSFSYVSSMGDPRWELGSTYFKPLNQEEEKHASTWQRFHRSCIFLNRFTVGAGRWHTCIGTESWRVAIIWRISTALLISLTLVGLQVSLTDRRLLGLVLKFIAFGSITVFAVDHKMKSEQSKNLDVQGSKTQLPPAEKNIPLF